MVKLKSLTLLLISHIILSACGDNGNKTLNREETKVYINEHYHNKAGKYLISGTVNYDYSNCTGIYSRGIAIGMIQQAGYKIQESDPLVAPRPMQINVNIEDAQSLTRWNLYPGCPLDNKYFPTTEKDWTFVLDDHKLIASYEDPNITYTKQAYYDAEGKMIRYIESQDSTIEIEPKERLFYSIITDLDYKNI